MPMYNIEVTAISGTSIEFHIEANGAKVPKMTIEDLAAKMDIRFDKVDERLDNIENRLEAIEKTPTMKKELILSK